MSWLRSGNTVKDKKVLLTGFSRGIGFGVADWLLSEGAEVIGVSKNPDNQEKAKQSLAKYGGLLTVVLADLALPEAINKIKEAVESRWDKLDILINNAGISAEAMSFDEEQISDLRNVLAVNTIAPHELIKALLFYLEKGIEPRIINVASTMGQLTKDDILENSNWPSYRVSKLALNAVTILWGNTLKGKISVLSFHPGWIKTDMGGQDAPDTVDDAVQRMKYIVNLPHSETGTFWEGEKQLKYSEDSKNE